MSPLSACLPPLSPARPFEELFWNPNNHDLPCKTTRLFLSVFVQPYYYSGVRVNLPLIYAAHFILVGSFPRFSSRMQLHPQQCWVIRHAAASCCLLLGREVKPDATAKQMQPIRSLSERASRSRLSLGRQFALSSHCHLHAENVVHSSRVPACSPCCNAPFQSP